MIFHSVYHETLLNFASPMDDWAVLLTFLQSISGDATMRTSSEPYTSRNQRHPMRALNTRFTWRCRLVNHERALDFALL